MKRLKLLVAIAFIAGLLSGCSENNTPSSYSDKVSYLFNNCDIFPHQQVCEEIKRKWKQ